jgi:hypothetical protein
MMLPRADSPPPITAARVEARILAVGTALRFALLLVLIFAGGVALLASLFLAVHPGKLARLMLCGYAAGYDPDADPLRNNAVLANAGSALRSCIAAADYGPALTRWTLVGSTLLLVLAAVVYWWLPTWRTWRQHLVPLAGLVDGEVSEELAGLVRAAGLYRKPRFVIDPGATTASAAVFGRPGRYTVSIHAGLLVRRTSDPVGFSSVVLHELTHIRNQDVDVTYAAIALWRVFLVCVLVPLILLLTVRPTLPETLQSWREDWSTLLRWPVSAAVLIALVYLSRVDILRTRELYADLDASAWSAAHAVSRPVATRPGRVTRAAALLFQAWRTHPRWEQRMALSTSTSALFALTPLPMFLTGASAMLAAHMAKAVTTGPLQTVPAWLTAVLTTAIAGTAAWRAAAFAVLTGRPAPSGLAAGAFLGAGLAVGELLTYQLETGWLPPNFFVALLLVPAGAMLTWWATECATLWIRTCRGRSIRLVQAVGILTTFVVFSIWFTYWTNEAHVTVGGRIQLSQQGWWNPPPGVNMPAGLNSVVRYCLQWLSYGRVHHSSTLVGTLVLWLFPLAALARQRSTATPGWVRAALPRGPEPVTAGDDPPGPRRLVLAALAGGILCTGSAALVMQYLHPLQPPQGERGAAWAILYLSCLVFALAASVSVTAAATAATAARYPLVLALATAGTAVLFGLAGQFLLAATDGCVPALTVMASSCAWRPVAAWDITATVAPAVLGLGMYAAAFSAMLGVLGGRFLRAVIRRRPRHAHLRPGKPAAARLTALRVYVAVTFALAVTLVLALTQGPLLSPSRPTPSPAGMLTVAGPQSPSPTTARTQVAAWMKVGGQTVLADISAALAHLGDALLAAAATGKGEIEAGVFKPICADLAENSRAGSRLLPVPDALAQRLWESVLVHAANAAADCLRGLDLGNGDLFLASRPEAEALAAARTQLYARLEQILAVPQR